MCLTGVDYFSTLGYQPGIAALAAGLLSPLATIVLVLLTLLGALPVYRRVAEESFRGEGSIAMLERLLPRWARQAVRPRPAGLRRHRLHDHHDAVGRRRDRARGGEPARPRVLVRDHTMLITLVLLALLGAVFLRGFSEAIGVAVVLVAVYLALNVVVVVVGLVEVISRTRASSSTGASALTTEHGEPLGDGRHRPAGLPEARPGPVRLRDRRRRHAADPGAGRATPRTIPPAGSRAPGELLTTAAVIMSVFLITSSFITTMLIPQQEFQPGGPANGRALAYLAHESPGQRVRHGLRHLAPSRSSGSPAPRPWPGC